MAKSCLREDSATKRFRDYHEDNLYNLMAEYGVSGVTFDVKSVFSGKIVSSHLYNDIINHPALNKLDQESRGIKAMEMYLEAYSDEFIESHGDWLNDKEKYKGSQRYQDTGEPNINDLISTRSNSGSDDKGNEKALKILETSIEDMTENLVKLQQKATTDDDQDTINRLKDTIASLKKSLEKKEAITGVRRYVQYLNDTKIKSLINRIEEAKLDNTIDVSSYFVNGLFDFIDLHNPNIRRLHAALSSSPELYSTYKSELEPILKGIESSMTEIESFAVSHRDDIIEDVAKKTYGDKFSIDTIRGWFKDSIKKDVSGMFSWLGIPANAPDQVIRLAIDLVKNISYKVNRIVKPKIDELVVLQVALNNAGFKNMDIFNETYKGKRTGFLINKHKWGEFYAAKDEKEEKIKKIFDSEVYTEALSIKNELILNNDLNDPRLIKFNEIVKEFNEKYIEDNKAVPPINEEFLKLMKNEAFKNYYNTLYDIHSKVRSRLPSSHRNGMHTYMLPQIRNSVLEAGKYGGVKKAAKVVGRKASEMVKTTEDDIEYGDIRRDKNGKILKVVPIHYTTRLSNQDELSSDITGMYDAYYTMAETFRQSSESVDELELIHRAMGEREIKTPKSAVVVKEIIDSHLYGQKVNDFTVKVGGKNYNLGKLVDTMLVKYPSSVNMFMSIPVTVSGFLKSRIDTQMENLAGTHVTHNSAAQATKEFIKQVPKIMTQTASKVKTNKIDLLLKFNQLDDIMYKQYTKLNIDTKIGRMLGSEIFYISMMPTGYASMATLALSIYYNYRLVEGEFITEQQFKRKYKDSSSKWSDYKGKSLYDAYSTNNGKFELKPEYRKYVSYDFERQISKKINKMSDVLEGRLSQFDKIGAHKTALGRAVMLHRGWIPQLAGNRFKTLGFDSDLNEDSEGFYRTIGRLTMNMFQKTEAGIRFKLSRWGDLEEFEKRNTLRFISDMTFLIALTIMAKVINNIADEDDEDKWFLEYMAYQANRLLLEQKAMIPVPFIGGGVSEIFNILNSPLPGQNQLEKLTDLSTMLFNGTDVIQSGAYKDKTKYERFAIQQFWLKNLYQIQYPKHSNSYLKSQILN